MCTTPRQVTPRAGPSQRTTGAGASKALAEAIRYAEIAGRRQPRRVSVRQLQLRLAAYELNFDLLRYPRPDPPADPASRRRETAKALVRSPDNPVLLNIAAYLAEADDDLEAAEGHLKQAIAATADRAPILHDRLGNVYYRMGRRDEANRQWQTYRRWTATLAPAAAERMTSLFKDAAAMDPHSPYRRLRMAQLAYHLGLEEIARRELAAAKRAEAALWPGSVMRFNERRQAEIHMLEAKLATTAPPGP